MNLFEVGRMAVKIAGRDAGKTCVVVDQLENGFVLVDGLTRRKKCNIKHLEHLPQVIKIKKGASHEEVKAEFKKIGLEVIDTKSKPATQKPKKQKKEKLQAKKVEKKKVVETKKVEKPKEVPKEEKASSFEETLTKETKKE